MNIKLSDDDKKEIDEVLDTQSDLSEEDKARIKGAFNSFCVKNLFWNINYFSVYSVFFFLGIMFALVGFAALVETFAPGAILNAFSSRNTKRVTSSDVEYSMNFDETESVYYLYEYEGTEYLCNANITLPYNATYNKKAVIVFDVDNPGDCKVEKNEGIVTLLSFITGIIFLPVGVYLIYKCKKESKYRMFDDFLNNINTLNIKLKS